MKRKFKRIYIEITNVCNFECPFCITKKRASAFMSTLQFKEVVEKVKDYTSHIYLHVLGESLLHPNLDEILDIAGMNNLKVNLTVNGSLLKKNSDLLLGSQALRQINVSLHSFSIFDESRQIKYLDELISFIRDIEREDRIYLSLRFWLGDNDKQNFSKNYLEKQLGISLDKNDKAVLNRVYVSHSEEFVWPEDSSNNESFNYCNGIKNQLAILVDGTVVPCCLDANGEIELGNIFSSNLEDILNQKRYLDMLAAFHTHKMTEELCLKCSFRNRFS